MTVEFISATFVNDRTELAPQGSQRSGSPTIDRAFLLRYARELDAAGFHYTLLPYGSSGYDPLTVAAAISQVDRLLHGLRGQATSTAPLVRLPTRTLSSAT